MISRVAHAHAQEPRDPAAHAHNGDTKANMHARPHTHHPAPKPAYLLLGQGVFISFTSGPLASYSPPRGISPTVILTVLPEEGYLPGVRNVHNDTGGTNTSCTHTVATRKEHMLLTSFSRRAPEILV
eukprot:631276-Pleurochrysis_carterae.AAC.1